MFILALALAANPAVVVEATGMKPQLRVIRQETAKRGWRITCIGHAGEEGVVRIVIPSGTPPQAVDTFSESVSKVGSSVETLSATGLSRKCDRTPSRAESSGPVTTLLMTKGVRDAGLLATARACGFHRARWRLSRAGDVAPLQGRADFKEYSAILDAGEDASTRDGPLICFLHMGVRPFMKRDR